MWFFGPKSIPLYRRMAAMLADKNIQLVLLHNSRLEERIGYLSGIPGHLLNQNMHVCEHVFQPCEVPLAYDAIYTASAAAYKRIHLALDVPRLFVLTYFWPDVRDENGKWSLALFDSRLASIPHNTDRVEPADVSKLLGSAQCGLALSQVEGAMFASMEYLMCGLPVVTTWNLGGRDFYLDESNSVKTRASRTAVRDGVGAVAKHAARKKEIRQNVLRKVCEQRTSFVALVSEVTRSDAVENIAKSWWAAPTGIAATRII
jgi:glycosyltransferase involved in cell wall biosynthesis